MHFHSDPFCREGEKNKLFNKKPKNKIFVDSFSQIKINDLKNEDLDLKIDEVNKSVNSFYNEHFVSGNYLYENLSYK